MLRTWKEKMVQLSVLVLTLKTCCDKDVEMPTHIHLKVELAVKLRHGTDS